MKFPCLPVTERFFDDAPMRFRSEAELPVSADVAFASLEDAHAWPRWFTDIRSVEWTTPRPFGVGTTRTVALATMTVYEYFFRWEQGKRFSFYFTDASVPLFRALAEDYLLEPLPNGRSRFVYTVAIDPSRMLALSGFLGRSMLEKTFKAAPDSFAKYLSKAEFHRPG